MVNGPHSLGSLNCNMPFFWRSLPVNYSKLLSLTLPLMHVIFALKEFAAILKSESRILAFVIFIFISITTQTGFVGGNTVFTLSVRLCVRLASIRNVLFL